MGAFGRLWERAPIWRRLLYLTCATTVLAWAYPPPWLGGVAPVVQRQVAYVASRDADPGAARPTAASTRDLAAQPTGDAQNAAENVPVLGRFYSGRLPFGSQSIPLPAGKWVALASQRGATAAGLEGESVLLAFVLDARLVALAMIAGSTADQPQRAGFAAPLQAEIPNYYYRRVFSAIDHGKVDLWVTGITQPVHWTDTFRKAALAALGKQSLTVPERFDSAVFRFADKRNWLSAEFMFPNPGTDVVPARGWIEAAALADSAALSHAEKVRRWGKAWHEVMRRAFDGAPSSGEEARIAMP